MEPTATEPTLANPSPSSHPHYVYPFKRRTMASSALLTPRSDRSRFKTVLWISLGLTVLFVFITFLSLKPAPLRVLLRVTGSNVDRERGLEEIRETALHGHYLEPFAKLLLAVAALRDNNPVRARELLGELHRRFPDNELYTREMDRIDKKAH